MMRREFIPRSEARSLHREWNIKMKLLICFGPLFKRNEDKKRLQQTRALYAISFKSKAAHVGDGVEEDAAADESIRKKHAVRKKSGSLDPAIVMQLESQLGDG